MNKIYRLEYRELSSRRWVECWNGRDSWELCGRSETQVFETKKVLRLIEVSYPEDWRSQVNSSYDRFKTIASELFHMGQGSYKFKWFNLSHCPEKVIFEHEFDLSPSEIDTVNACSNDMYKLREDGSISRVTRWQGGVRFTPNNNPKADVKSFTIADAQPICELILELFEEIYFLMTAPENCLD